MELGEVLHALRRADLVGFKDLISCFYHFSAERALFFIKKRLGELVISRCCFFTHATFIIGNQLQSR
ncbi:hypothetical protein IB69_017310 [Xanthomonas citri]|nr:hypothetical protein IB69_017310 [Xanthomonas citri]